VQRVILNGMALVIDIAAAGRTVSDEEFGIWAQSQTLFLSSVMGELAGEREQLARALCEAGFIVRRFEDFGGRDDSAEDAYLAEVAGSDVYLGVLGDEYGTMLATGFSPTHAEYLEARRLGRHITFWARGDASNRAGHARNFLSEVQAFQVTGSYDDADDLVVSVLARLREMAAEDLAPWVKVGDIIVRAESITDSGSKVRIEARVRGPEVVRALQALAPDGQWHRGERVRLTTAERSGQGTASSVEVQTRSQAIRDVVAVLDIEWVSGGDSMAAGTTNYTAEDLVEAGVRAGLLKETLPAGLSNMAFLVDATDPLAELEGARIPEGSLEAIARLLVVEQLVGGRKAGAITGLTLGPNVGGRRRVALSWRDAQRYTNVTPANRSVEGEREWG